MKERAIIMKKLLALLILTGLFCGIMTGAFAEGGAEGIESPATSSDLCAHEHTREVFYFDQPEYTPVDAEKHRVTGSAIVNTVCDDCGEVIRSESRDNTEEIRYHIFKKGSCVLCRQPAPEKAKEEVTKVTLISPKSVKSVMPEAQTDGTFSLVLTEGDLAALEAEGVETLVIREDGAADALALPVKPVRAEMAAAGSDLNAETAPQPNGSLFAALRLVKPDGIPTEVQSEGIALRFYGKSRQVQKAIFTPEAEGDAVEQPAAWTEPTETEEGYFSVPWLGSGRYLLIE